MLPKQFQILTVFVVLTGFVSCTGIQTGITTTDRTDKKIVENPAPVTDTLQSAKRPHKVQITTPRGDMILELFPDKAPQTVNDFLDLAEKDFYRGHTCTIRRGVALCIIPPIPAIKPVQCTDESNTLKSRKGSVAVGKSVFSSLYINQFFIALGPQPKNEQSFTIFGEVVDGLDVLDKIRQGDRIIKVALLDE